jgi:Zn-dependent peptidase ImmA (M78 family)
LPSEKYREIRANYFAAAYLAPKEYLQNVPEPKIWDENKILTFSQKMKINPQTLSIALYTYKLISYNDKNIFSRLKFNSKDKIDVELLDLPSKKIRDRDFFLLNRGLNKYYLDLRFDAYRQCLISKGKLSEILLCTN